MIPHGFDRVTDVLSSLNNYSHIDPIVLENAANRGKKVHGLCERYAGGEKLIRADEECQHYFQSYIEWFDKMVVEVTHLETRVNSFKIMLSGQIDMVCKLKGDKYLTLVDIKTPATPAPTWHLQTAAYKMLLREEMGVEVARRMCLMLPKHCGQASIKEYTDHNLNENQFLKVLANFRERKFNALFGLQK